MLCPRKFSWAYVLQMGYAPKTQMVPPIECDLGYRFPTRTLNPNLNPNPDLDPSPNPSPNPNTNRKVTEIYAVQNDTQIKFKIVL